MRIVIAGIPGSGKTTVIQEALKMAEFDVINYGDVMFETAKQQGLVEKRDDMRSLPFEEQTAIQMTTAKTIVECNDILIDTHCTIKTPYGYLPGLPIDVLNILKPSVIILIETDPEDIEARRDKDAKIRNRDKESITDMNLHQMMNRIAAMNYAVIIGATVKIIQNKQGDLDKAAKELIEVIQ